jgi:hypothetical protein
LVPDPEVSLPKSVVWRIAGAAQNGDVKGYLACYGGGMENSLRKNAEEMGPKRFRQYLINSSRDIRGIVVMPPLMVSVSESRLSVEYVYQDRSEVQQLSVRKIGDQWKVFGVEGAERVKTLVPYGTPVHDSFGS